MVGALRVFVIVGLALGALLMPVGGLAQPVPPARCQLFAAGGTPPTPQMNVNWVSRFHYVVPAGQESVAGSASVSGHPGWAPFIDNDTGTSVTNPTVTLSSGLDPSVFDGQLPTAGFPSSCSLPSLANGQEMQIFPGLEAPGVHISSNLGYDSSRSVTPSEVPVGGGDVTATFSVTLTDARFAAGGYVFLGVQNGGPVTITQMLPPTNLGDGESVSVSGNQFNLANAQLGKTYLFTAKLHVSNPPFDGQVEGPWTFEPGASIFGSSVGGGGCVICGVAGPSVTITDPSLDGATPGSGSVTFSIGESDRTWFVNRSTQYVTSYQQGLFPDLVATVDSGLATEVSQSTNSVTTATTFTGQWNWGFQIGNFQPENTVTNPTISVASGYDASQLDPYFGAPASSLPIVVSQPSLPSGSTLNLPIGSMIEGTFNPGCDTSRSVSPLTVPVGGGDQTITFTIRCEDPGVVNVNGGVQGFLPGSTLVSFTPPSNLDQGEGLNAPPNSWFGAPGDVSAGFGIGVENLITGKQYTFSFVVHSPNPFGVPFAQTPDIGLVDESPQPTGCFGCGGSRSTITVAEPTLDGATTGAGSVTFSTGEPHVWNVDVRHSRKVEYDGTVQQALDYQGPASAVDGQQATFTASWEGFRGQAGTPVTFTLGTQSCTATTAAVPNPFGDQGAVCSIVLAQPVGSYTLQISSPGDVSVYPASTSAPFTITGPTSIGQCKDGGWKVFGVFKNQGDCVSYVATKGKNPPAGH